MLLVIPALELQLPESPLEPLLLLGCAYGG